MERVLSLALYAYIRATAHLNVAARVVMHVSTLALGWRLGSRHRCFRRRRGSTTLDSDSRTRVDQLGDPDDLLVPKDLGDHVAVGDELGTVPNNVGIDGRGRGRGRGGRSSLGRNSGNTNVSRRGRGGLGLIDRGFLEDLTGEGTSRVRGKGTRLVGLRGLGRLRDLVVVGRTILIGDLDIAGQEAQALKNFLRKQVNWGLELALTCLSLVEDVEDGAVLDAARGVGARVNGVLKEVGIPAHEEVTMVAESGGVAIGEDKHAIAAFKSVGGNNGLEEDTRELDWVRIGTVAVHDKVRVGNVRLVVRALGILAVPARREHELEAEAILAVSVEILLVGHKVAVKSALGLLVVVETVEAQGALLELVLGDLAQGSPVGLCGIVHARVASGELAAVVVTGNHLEVGRESLDLLAVKEIIGKHASDLFDVLVLASFGVLEVHGGSPVRRLVLADTARGAVAIEQRSGISDLAKARRTEDGVRVRRSLAKVDDGVHARQTDATGAFHAPEGMSTAHKAGRSGDQRFGEHGGYIQAQFRSFRKEWNDATRLSGDVTAKE